MRPVRRKSGISLHSRAASTSENVFFQAIDQFSEEKEIKCQQESSSPALHPPAAQLCRPARHQRQPEHQHGQAARGGQAEQEGCSLQAIISVRAEVRAGATRLRAEE